MRGALGPYLNVFLVTQQHWSQSSVGVVTTVSRLLGLIGQTPAGAAIDASTAKRGLIIGALVLLAAGAIGIYALPTFWPVLAADTLIGLVGDVFGPAVAALTLGLFARRALAGHLGRNSAFDHAGNVTIAAAAGVVGWLFSQRAVFSSCSRVPRLPRLKHCRSRLARWTMSMRAAAILPVAATPPKGCRLCSAPGRAPLRRC